MKTQPQDIVGFHFQVIPLAEAQSMAIAGSGNYSELKAKLLQEIPKLKPDESFAFGLPKGEIPEDQRRNICKALNNTFKAAKLHWRVAYSGVKRLFICIPPNSRTDYKPRETPKEYIPQSKWNDIDDEPILNLWNKGYSVQEIIKQLDTVPPARVKYVCYQKHPRKKSPTHPGYGKMPDDKGALEMESMMREASRLFKVTEEQIKKGMGRGRKVRKAICTVAVERNIAPRLITSFVGLTKSGVKFNATQNTKYAKEEIETLRKFYGR